MRISNITKKFDRFSLNWQKSTGFAPKIYGIIGPNGCGKTTLLKIMAGLIKPDGGEIDYNGLSPKDITMVFRKPYLMQDKVYKNLVYPLKLRKIDIDEAQVEAHLRLAGLLEMRNQYAPSLSSGEQQKLSLARALIFKPKLIFIDEAFSNMDIESVSRFEEHILKAQSETPVIWVIVSHQLANIKRLCDYVYFLHDGALDAEGPTGEILQNPHHPNLEKYLQYQAI